MNFQKIIASVCLLSLVGQGVGFAQGRANPTAQMLLTQIGSEVDRGLDPVQVIQAHHAALAQVTAAEWRELLAKQLSAQELAEFDQRTAELQGDLTPERVAETYSPLLQRIQMNQGLTWTGENTAAVTFGVSVLMLISGILVYSQIEGSSAVLTTSMITVGALGTLSSTFVLILYGLAWH